MDHEILTGKQALEDLESDWAELWPQAHLQSFYLTYDMAYAQLNFSRFAPDDVMFIRFFDQGRSVAICPLCLSRRGRVLKLKSLEILRTPQAPLRSCLVHRDYVEPVAHKLAELIQNDFPRPFDVVTLESISPNDAFMSLLETELSSRLGVHFRHNTWPNFVVQVDSAKGAEGFFRSRGPKFRKTLVRSINLLGKKCWWSVIICRRPGPVLEQGLEKFSAMYHKAWQKQRDPQYHQQFARRMAEKDMLRLFLLVVRPEVKVPKEELPIQSYASDLRDDQPFPPDGQPIATMLTYRFQDQVQFVRTAFDHDYQRNSPGTLLAWYVYKYYLDQGGVNLFDLEAGDEPYKRTWGEVSEYRHLFQAARPWSWRALLEVPAEKHLVPLMRRITRRNTKHR